ncbi:DUF4468 domain-containing protein [uncultured Proteiniphilum sp.]|mgnify:CR=1 FL=1|uniref:DUF4468 domain-containing protein n=1 Tax=uncultured Proteiniphilum sp. TaxID=497637 RepID=UPI00261A2A7A|nr:DUF4468 domain-containing protein [uncultured Proteiniphilum sp.]
MKRSIVNLLLVTTVLLFCMVSILPAQNYGASEYLKGAVPLEDGAVVFRESFSAPHISRDSLMRLTREWINGRDNPEEERSSRVLIFEEEKGLVVGGCREKLVFKSALLVLDQADINYYIHTTCTDGAVDMAIIRIRYEYEEDQRYTAEEMITDEVSLDKDQGRILKSSEKWRIKTIDFMRDLFRDYNNFLSRNL